MNYGDMLEAGFAEEPTQSVQVGRSQSLLHLHGNNALRGRSKKENHITSVFVLRNYICAKVRFLDNSYKKQKQKRKTSFAYTRKNSWECFDRQKNTYICNDLYDYMIPQKGKFFVIGQNDI